MITIDRHYLLNKEFSYYRKLSPSDQKLFRNRIQEFIQSTSFEGRKGLVVTETMQVLIAATAVQLTLGFYVHYNYEHFKKVLLYPEKYLSHHTGQYHTGEMNTAGVIVFSWKDFYEGIKVDQDSRNVGLHEFAHALEFIDKADLGIDDYFAHAIEKIKTIGRQYIQRQPDVPFFRSYAATNTSEFFAVGTEYFFEAPSEFKRQMPDLYRLYTIAYRQNRELNVYNPYSTSSTDTLLLGQKGTKSGSQWMTFISLMLISVSGALVFWNQHYPNVVEGLPLPATYLFLVFNIGMFIYFFFQSHIGWYATFICIYPPIWKSILRWVLRKEPVFAIRVPLTDVFLIQLNDEHDNGEYSITCSYLDAGILRHTTVKRRRLLAFRHLFSAYYHQHQIAFKENGKVKKFPLT